MNSTVDGLPGSRLSSPLRAHRVRIPSLLDRIEDLGLLIHRILNELGATHVKFAADAYARMCLYDWPENVRQLRHFLVAAAQQEGLVTVPFVESHGIGPSRPSRDAAELEPLSIDYVKILLRERRGNVQSAADALGVNRMRLHRLLKKHGVDPNTFRRNPRQPHNPDVYEEDERRETP